MTLVPTWHPFGFAMIPFKTWHAWPSLLHACCCDTLLKQSLHQAQSMEWQVFTTWPARPHHNSKPSWLAAVGGWRTRLLVGPHRALEQRQALLARGRLGRRREQRIRQRSGSRCQRLGPALQALALWRHSRGTSVQGPRCGRSSMTNLTRCACQQLQAHQAEAGVQVSLVGQRLGLLRVEGALEGSLSSVALDP